MTRTDPELFPCKPLRAIFFLAAVCSFAGCRSEPASSPSTSANATPVHLRLTVVDDPGLAKFIKREWEARSAGELTVRDVTEAELLKLDQRRIGADAIVYPAELLGEIAAREWLEPLPKDRLDDPVYSIRDIFAATLKYDATWGEETYAVPLGAPPLVLFCRSDVFAELSLQPPETWKEYQTVGEQLADSERVKKFRKGESPWHGVSEPLGKSWASQLLLARAAAYGKHRSQFSALFDYRTLTPLIAGPPFVRALEELAAAAKWGPPADESGGPAESVQRLLQGECAMAIGWLPEAAANAESASPRGESPLPIQVVPLPGSRDVYNFRSADWESRVGEEGSRVPLIGVAGRLASLTNESREPVEAVRLLLWLSGPEMSAPISAAGSTTAPFRQSHVSQIEQWTRSLLSQNVLARETAEQYAAAVAQSLAEPNCLTGLRIPGREQYLAQLEEGIRKVLAGDVTAAAALAEVAQQWEQLTDSLGRDAQRQAYALSIGLQP